MPGLSNSIYKDDHKMVNYLFGKKSGLVGFIAIHRGNKKFPSFGATRIWNYKNEEEALKDALRLSKLMSYKAAIAKLQCGGAKGTIYVKDYKILEKKVLLKAYADRVNLLGGRFITGADVGISRDEVIYMRRYCDHVVGVKVDPVRFTGLGIVYSIQECLKEVFGTESFVGKRFAIQGVGKVGRNLLKSVYDYAQTIYISDIEEETLKRVSREFPKVKIVEPSLIHKLEVEVFSPCALSNTVTKKTIKELKCRIIAGGANNQLEIDELADDLYKRGILYAPDYVVNSGGLISVFDEYEHRNYRIKRVEKRVSVIKENMKLILSLSKRSKKAPLFVANEIAEKRFDAIV